MPDPGATPAAVHDLCAALEVFEPVAQRLQLPPLAGREWYELLMRKLRPQLGEDSFLIAAVVGGTNIGKSVVFNHAAGFRASATSPLASGTRHPTCLAPTGFSRRHDVGALFTGFTVTPWTGADGALSDEAQHRLFWRESPEMPANLLLLDTPDIDSDARINWERADHVRQAADLLIAVLTQQKYNDAAVKEFFRKAAAEEKAVVVILNQVLLPEDEPYWPLWLETFCRETGIEPQIVYVAPADRRAAEAIELPFFERAWPPEKPAKTDDPKSPRVESRSLLSDLSRLRFQEIKWRSLRGSLRQTLDPASGAPAYLREVRARVQEFRAASEQLSAGKLAEVKDWPTAPAAAVVSELRRWWRDQREGWSRQVHGFYNAVGAGISWPFQKLKVLVKGEPRPLFDAYREREWSGILSAVSAVYDRLTMLAELGNELLQPRLQEILNGTSRTQVLDELKRVHRDVRFEEELRLLVDDELKTFRSDSPNAYELFRKVDMAAAAARPVTSVALFVVGFGPVGHAVTPIFADAAMQGVVHIAGDVVGGTVAGAVGETVLSSGAGTSVGYFEARFRGLQTRYAAQRAAWLAGQLQRTLLGSMPGDLQQAASTTTSEEYRRVQQALERLQRMPG
ncbi:MAG: 50S ribosome-binding GTPase [Planctomyces sp.]|nr:50S ribosome-binding GTPase [Planctomyces sp.]